ncbi:MAG: DUF1003 domain-containing protein [Clostridiales bacterium]|nr:DUF1003 domain-containing protein [Clostridiales bacterium]
MATEKAPARHEKASKIRGYNIELNEEKLSRIDRMVESYERRVAARLDEEYEQHTRRSDRVADKVAAFGGSWTFIIIFACFLAMWVLLNVLPFLGVQFDPKPFILLNLILSFIAAFQAPIIMMSQNRQAARDKHEAIIDFAINYKAEQEIDDLQRHLHRMEAELAEMKELLKGRE